MKKRGETGYSQRSPVRLIILVVCAYLAYRALRSLLRRLLEGPREEGAGELVRDPECGVYVPKAGSVTRWVKGGVARFCSEECAAAHRAKGRG